MQPSATIWSAGALLVILIYLVLLRGVTYGVSRRFAPLFRRQRRRPALPGLGYERQ